MKLGSLWELGVQELGRAGVSDARWQSELLLRFVTGLSRHQFLAYPERAVNDEMVGRYQGLLRARADGMPIQYLMGSTEFFGRDFSLNPHVLIPRPDTEILVETALRLLRGQRDKLLAPRKAPWQVLDLCTGSGCVGITIAAEMPDATVLLTDISPPALALAGENASRLGVLDRVTTACGDLFAPVPPTRFDMILSNPPYIATAEIESLPAEVRREPHAALDGGDDGLDFYRRIAATAPGYLVAGGWLLFEIGYTQRQAVCDLLEQRGFTEVLVQQDLAGLDRVVGGRLPLDRGNP